MVLQLFLRLPGGAVRACQAQPCESVASVSSLDAYEAADGAAPRVVCGGRTLDPHSSLAAARVPPGATLELLPRLRGGGGDGGSTGAESRSSYLEMYAGKKADKVNPEEERLARWNFCQLSGMPLQPPCVADELGSLFNKDAVLQALLNKSMPRPLAHITSLKHLIELKFGDSGGSAGSAGAAPSSRASAADIPARFACPITGLPFNGKSRFVVLRRSGHVLSERALKEVPKVVEEMVGGPWQPEDLLPVNPSGDELQAMREALLLKRTAERAARKEKKKDKATMAAAANGGDAAASTAAAGENGTAAAGSKRAAENCGKAGGAAAAAAANGDDDPAAAAAAAKRFKTAELKPKGADDKVWSSIFTSSSSKQGGNDYMIRGFTRYI